MKICPFISHILGEDSSNILTADTTSAEKLPEDEAGEGKENASVLALGYDSEEWGEVQTMAIPAGSATKAIPPHLLCLKDACRFFKKKTGDCMFEQMFSLIQNQKKEDGRRKGKPGASDAKIEKELEKFWKFQTKGVAEMIESIGETEKNQKKTLENFKSDLIDRVETLASREKNVSLEPLKENIQKLHAAIEEREEGIDSLSTMVSDMVVNMEEGLSKLNEKVLEVSQRLGKLVQLEEKLSAWRKELDQKVTDLKEQQIQWDRQLTSLDKHQNELMAFFEEDKKRHDMAEDRVRKKEARKFNNLGVTSFHNGAFEIARDQLLQAVKLDQEFAEAHNNLGLVYTELREEENATEAFKKAIELNPDLSAAYNNLGYLFYKQGSYEQAIEMYDETLGRSADSSSAYTNLGNAYYKLGKIDKAREMWSKAIEIDPGNEKPRRFLKRIEAESN